MPADPPNGSPPPRRPDTMPSAGAAAALAALAASLALLLFLTFAPIAQQG